MKTFTFATTGLATRASDRGTGMFVPSNGTGSWPLRSNGIGSQPLPGDRIGSQPLLTDAVATHARPKTDARGAPPRDCDLD